MRRLSWRWRKSDFENENALYSGYPRPTKLARCVEVLSEFLTSSTDELNLESPSLVAGIKRYFDLTLEHDSEEIEE